MGFLKKIIKNGIGLAGNQVMNMANSATGGLAGKIFNATVNKVNKNSGIIGKVARGLGKKFLNDKTREKISNITDTAIKYIPKGNVRTALENINNAAQGKSNHNIKTKYNKQLDSTEPASVQAIVKPKRNIKTKRVRTKYGKRLGK